MFKAFDTVWIDGLLYKLTLINFPSYIVHTISSYLRVRCSKRPSRQPRHLVAVCGLGYLRVDWSALSSSVCLSTTCPHLRTTSSWPTTRTTWPSETSPPSRRCSSGTWSHISMNFNGGWVNGESPLMSPRALRYSSRGPDGASSSPDQQQFRGNNSFCRQNSLSGGDPRYTTHLVASHPSGQEENYTKDGRAGSAREQEKWSVRRERSPAKQAAHPPHDRLCVPRMEARCPHRGPEGAGVAIQVSSPCCGWPLEC